MKQQLLYPVNEECSGGMASNIAKWWKNKFNGYRQFTVLPTDCSDGRPSDTEDLLGGRRSESIPIHHPPPVQKPPSNNSNKTSSSQQRHHQQPQPEPTRPPQLDFEEFECDVEVEGGGFGSGGSKQRQEFSFTLYDLEGHGKITKDDIASLVKTIYDTLGSSIKVPHYGSKTIKVKLTVAPDQLKRQHHPPTQQHLPPNPYHTQTTLNNVSSSKVKRDLNVTIRESRLRRPVRRRKQKSTSAPTNHSPSTQVTSVTTSTIPGRGETISSGRSCTSSSSGDTPLVVDLEVNDEPDANSTAGLLTQAEPDLVGGLSNRKNKTNKRISHASSMGICRDRVRRYSRSPHNVTTSTQPKSPPPEGTSQPTSSNSNSYFQQHHPERKSGSMQREELLQIIQANMDKNNLTFQTSRKAYFDRNGFTHPNYRPRQKTMHSELFDSSKFGEVAGFGGVTTCYLDLANDRNHHPHSQNYLPQHLTSMPRNKNVYDSRYDKFRSPKYRNLRTCHNRSRSHDTSVPTEKPTTPPPLPSPEVRLPETIPPSPPPIPETPFHYRSKSAETAAATAAAAAAVAAAEAMTSHKFVTGHTSSPHYEKHRTREHDQARAMAQVVKWLEQEFSLNKTSSDLGVTTTTTTTTNKVRNDHVKIVSGTPSADKPGENNPAGNSSSGSAIEHHHVHEHIHHHYHHYQDAPVLV